MYKNIRLIYTLIIGTFSIALFIYGFFPIVHYDNTIASINDIPQFIDNVRYVLCVALNINIKHSQKLVVNTYTIFYLLG